MLTVNLTAQAFQVLPAADIITCPAADCGTTVQWFRRVEAVLRGMHVQALLSRVFAASEYAWQLRASQCHPLKVLPLAFAAWKHLVQEQRIHLAKQQAASIAHTHW